MEGHNYPGSAPLSPVSSSANIPQASDEAPFLILKPRIVAGVLPKFIYTIIVVGFITYYILGTLLMGVFIGLGLILIFPIVIILASLVSVFLSYMNLRAREYRFFSDKAEFYEGFLNINRKVVRYERITDITFRKSVWERIWGTGTILLSTAGAALHELKISYIRNPEKTYQDIQNILRNYAGGRTGTEAYSPRPPPPPRQPRPYGYGQPY